MSCCVKQCKSIKRLMPPGSNVSFHRLPKDRFEEFSKIVGLDTNIYSIRYICSRHFLDSDFVASSNRRYLKSNALPSININGSKLFEDVKTEQPNISEYDDSYGMEQSHRLTYKVEDNSFSEYSASEDLNQTRVQFIKVMHSYSENPAKIKSRLQHCKQELRRKTKQVCVAKKTILKLNKKVSYLNTIIANLKSTQALCSKCMEAGETNKHHL